MGHVDHGKTTLLDAIRGTNVQGSETGGITQNTRAHQIEYKGNKITFLDTPGHEAFSSMRSRGAKVTDIVLLVVAVDDGVQPQTKESIKFALEEKVPMIVAVNKIDMPGKKSQKIKQELTTAGLVLEEYGGEVMLVEVSALKKTGIDELLDRILLIAEMQEFKKDEIIGMKGRLYVLESKLSQSQGAVALCLVKGGKIDQNDYIVCDGEVKKIRTLLDHNQKNITVAEQGDPVWIIGSDKVLPTGKILEVYETEKEAQKAIKRINQKADEPSIVEAIAATPAAPEIENNLELLSQMITTSRKTEEIKFLNVIVKADTQGTLEAVIESLKDLNDDFVQVKIILSGTGKITEKDILAAKNSKGIVIGFQVEMDRHTEVIARKEKVLVRVYQIIYDLIDELGEAMNSLIEPEFKDVEVSRAKVKKVFILTNKKIVAGCLAIKGNIVRGYKVHLERAGEKIGESKIVSLKKLKEEVKEITKGQECGILLEPSLDVQEDDEIICVKTERV
jgi:translation initiation factor IF-2